MTRTVPSALNTHLQGGCITAAICVKVKRRDGIVLGFTEVDKDLDIDIGDGDGTITYSSENSFTGSAVSLGAQMKVDNAEVEGILGSISSSSITYQDIIAGRYDHAEIAVFRVNYESLGDGFYWIIRGQTGEIEVKGTDLYVTEVRSLVQKYSQTIGVVTQPGCGVILGSTKCGVRVSPPVWTATTPVTVREVGDAKTGSVVAPTVQNGRHFRCTTAGTTGASEPTWNTTLGATTNDGTAVWTTEAALSQTGTVSVVTSQQLITATGVSIAVDHFRQGVLTWTGGLNNGIQQEVKTDDGSGVFGLFLPAPFAIAVSDTFTVTAGCERRYQEDCINRFDNVENFRGFPFIPGVDVALQTPDAK